MDQKEAEFIQQLMASFRVEADEHIKNLSDGLLALEQNPQKEKQKEIIETIYREAHNLKGAARAVNKVAVQDICQELETVLLLLKQEKTTLSADLVNHMYNTLDNIQKNILQPSSQNDEEDKTPKEILENLVQKHEDLDKSTVSSSLQERMPETKKNCEPVPFERGEAKSEPSSPENYQIKTIRLNQKKLDKLMQEVEEMLIIKLIAGQRYGHLKQMLGRFKSMEKKWRHMQKDFRYMRQAFEDKKNYIPSKEFLEVLESQAAFFKICTDEFELITKNANQDYRLTGGMIDNLLDNTKKVLMQPFSSLFDQFPRMLRDLSHKLGKNVQLVIQGNDIEVDKRILDEMKDPLIHIIRNCIDHGIESPEERKKQDKNPEGRVILSAMQIEGNTVEICIADDGCGLQVSKIKKSAVLQGIISQKEADELSDYEAIYLIFKSGVTTSPILTELSGRGLGLGIVMEKVEKLGGRIQVDTKPQIGTTFRITLPLTIATFRGVHVQTAGQDFIIPTHHLNRVLRIKPEDIKTIEGTDTLNINGKNISFIELSALLNISAPQALTDKKYLYALIVQTSEAIVALGVDHICNEQEVFIKGFGKQFIRVKNITAATVMEWGKVIAILDPFELVKTVKTLAGKKTKRPAKDDKEIRKKAILVTDDSITARILLKNILESAGYIVRLAIDGIEAFSILKTEPVDLLLTDIEMPRLDGFKLTEKIRNFEEFKRLPVVLCTSKSSKEDREHGIEVGANAYIEKSNFAQSNLLDIIQKLI